MQRFPDWHIRLERFIRESAQREFHYGVFDCALFACNAIAVMTGVDPACEFRGRYDSRDTARALLRSAGGFTAVAARYQLVEITIPLARRGDVLLMKRSALGLMALNGREVLVLTGKGLALIASSAALKAWRV